MNEKISVIIPVYNVKDYLSRCLDSIVKNTYKNLEIVCVDDGSTDDSFAVLNEYSKLDSRVKIIKKENGGVSSARNVGMKNCNGDFISFVDADDWIHPLYFEILLNVQNSNDSDIVISNLKTVSEKADFENISISNYNIKELNLDQIYSNHGAKSYVTGRLFRRSIIEDFTFPENVSVLEDAIFNAKVLCGTSKLKVSYIPVEMYYYFSRSDSLMHQINALSFLGISELYLEYSLSESDPRHKKIFLVETIKRTLFTRYVLSFSKENDVQVKKCNDMLLLAVRHLNKMDFIPLIVKLKYLMLYLIPQAYRIFRVLNDPTMLDWEKNQKNSK